MSAFVAPFENVFVDVENDIHRMRIFDVHMTSINEFLDIYVSPHSWNSRRPKFIRTSNEMHNHKNKHFAQVLILRVHTSAVSRNTRKFGADRTRITGDQDCTPLYSRLPSYVVSFAHTPEDRYKFHPSTAAETPFCTCHKHPDT